jgi:hypothetical protein
VGADRGQARVRGQEKGGARSQVDEVGGITRPYRALAWLPCRDDYDKSPGYLTLTAQRPGEIYAATVATAPAAEVEKVETIDKDHGRFEVRNYSVSHQVDWYAAERSYPGAPRFPQLTTIALVESRIECGDKIESERRSYISSRTLPAAAFAGRHAVCGRSKTSCTGFST